MNWQPIEKAPKYVLGRDALVGQYVPTFGWKKVTIWEREWTRKDCISRGATHWWPHLRNLPEPQAVVGIPTNGDYGQTGSGSARSDQPDAYLVVKRDTLSAQRTTFATLPGYSLAPGETLISETPLVKQEDCDRYANLLRPEVLAFASVMESKLRANDHKAHWRECSLDYLLTRLEQEALELREAINCGEGVISEAADVANFAMMIADIVQSRSVKEEKSC